MIGRTDSSGLEVLEVYGRGRHSEAFKSTELLVLGEGELENVTQCG